MNSKIKNHQKIQYKIILNSLGAWLMALATLIGMADVAHEPRAVVNVIRPAYASISDASHLWNRGDNENETVHMPTKFDIGLRIPGIAGRR